VFFGCETKKHAPGAKKARAVKNEKGWRSDPSTVEHQPSHSTDVYLCGLAQHESLGQEEMTPRIAVVTATRSSADLPSRSVVAARRAPHVHAVAFEVQDGVVASEPAEQLTEAVHCSGHRAAGTVVSHFRRRRELLGVVGHHERFSLSFLADYV
jgi:hypothetical protein